MGLIPSKNCDFIGLFTYRCQTFVTKPREPPAHSKNSPDRSQTTPAGLLSPKKLTETAESALIFNPLRNIPQTSFSLVMCGRRTGPGRWESQAEVLVQRRRGDDNNILALVRKLFTIVF